jgi:hypothetical protein
MKLNISFHHVVWIPSPSQLVLIPDGGGKAKLAEFEDCQDRGLLHGVSEAKKVVKDIT